MMPNMQFALNQQFQQGCAFAQQAMMAEQMGNLAAAAQCYDQAIGMIGNAMAIASQSGMPIMDNVFFSFAYCHFNAARVKATAGWPQFTPMHLAQAQQALSQAIAINPNFPQYHAAAGVVLLAEGNVAMAAQSFQRAVALNPMDSWSQWMLASLYQMQGNAGAAQQYYAAAAQGQPGLPPPQQFVQQYQGPPPLPGSGGTHSGKASQKDWIELLNNALKFGNTMAGLFQQGGGDGGSDQSMSWNQSGWGY